MTDDVMDELTIATADLPILDEVDEVVSKAVLMGDPSIAFEFGKHLGSGIKVRGIALAKLLWRIDQNWDLFKAGGIEEEFETMVYLHMGVMPDTAKKYVHMWNAIFENVNVPDDMKKLLQGRNILDLLKLTAAIRDGSLQGDELKDVVLTTASKDLPAKIREKRGEHTSSSTGIRIFLQKHNTPQMPAGTVYAMKGNQMAKLFIILPQDSDFGEQAIERIINASGIVERYGAA